MTHTEENVDFFDFFDNPVLYFTRELLLAPPQGVTVDWSDYNQSGCSGIVVKIPALNRVWRLTGRYDADHDGYEACWPD